MSPDGPAGVLVMAYGTPERTEDLEAYYTDIRRGRPPTPAELADLRRRYDAIGGLSPLARLTRGQAAALQEALDARHPARFRVALGLKHARPSVEEGVATLVAAGCAEVRALVLAPHYSVLSAGQYHDRVRAACRRSSPPVPFGWRERWHLEPALVRLLAERVEEAMRRFADRERVELMVTAHSLPQRAAELDRPSYPDQLRQTAQAVAREVGVPRWRVAWQSAGRTPEPWLGPDILAVLRSLAGDRLQGVVVCPAGFVADHLEVLYDVDIEARAVAAEAGLRLERTASLNDDPGFVDLLADIVEGITVGGRE